MYKKILLASDGSDAANKAAMKVIEFQKIWNSKVVVFHSLQHPVNIHFISLMPLASCYYSSSFIEVEEYNLNEQVGEKILKDTKKMFDNAHVSIETRLIKKETPEDYVERIIKEEDFDLIVLGIKGVHSKSRQNFIGSITEHIAKYAPCDVLVVK